MALVGRLLGIASLAAASPPNVLFVAIDDLRAAEALGADAKTPNLDAFRADAVTFANAHVQQSVCSPSRTSLLFGRRPDTTHVYDLYNNAREVGCADCVTIPGLFTENGYFTVGMGKIFHPGHASNNSDPQSWTDVNGTTTGPNWFNGDDQYLTNNHSWLEVNESEGDCQDTQVKDHALGWLDSFSSGTAPWFLAVGYHKPHLNWACPAEFFDERGPAYPSANDTELVDNPYAPEDMPAVAYASFELQNYADIAATGFAGGINQTLVDWKAREARRAYRACVSYTDYNVGVLLNATKAHGFYEDAVVVLFGDHGWKLGHHGAWAKHTNFREDTRAPLVIKAPGVLPRTSQALVEHVDLMATLLELTGLAAVETCPVDDPWTVARCSEGSSLVPLLNADIPWKNASYSQYPRGDDIMGYSMTANWTRFTAWVKFDSVTNTTQWEMDGCGKCAFELYDHSVDAEENVNLAGSMPDEVATRFAQLQAGWRATASGLVVS